MRYQVADSVDLESVNTDKLVDTEPNTSSENEIVKISVNEIPPHDEWWKTTVTGWKSEWKKKPCIHVLISVSNKQESNSIHTITLFEF